ncbi:CPBP family intramembrane glutamic endopeptidase [Mucilaginibacter conchicola]|nr:type II CAAX endopeptidase family protein [Mucilaginibacter conchicola]
MDTKPLSPTKRTAIMIGIVLVIMMLFLSGLFVPKNISLSKRLLVHEAIMWGTATFAILYAFIAERLPLFNDEKKHDANFYLSWILGLFVAGIGANFLANLICGIFRIPFDAKAQHEVMILVTSNNWIMLLCAVTAGVTEEIIFRGYLLEKFHQLFNDDKLAIGLSAALFAFGHSGYHSLRTMVYTFIFGCLLGLHYRHYKSITVLILAHAFFDLVIFLYYKNTF